MGLPISRRLLDDGGDDGSSEFVPAPIPQVYTPIDETGSGIVPRPAVPAAPEISPLVARPDIGIIVERAPDPSAPTTVPAFVPPQTAAVTSAQQVAEPGRQTFAAGGGDKSNAEAPASAGRSSVQATTRSRVRVVVVVVVVLAVVALIVFVARGRRR